MDDQSLGVKQAGFFPLDWGEEMRAQSLEPPRNQEQEQRVLILVTIGQALNSGSKDIESHAGSGLVCRHCIFGSSWTGSKPFPGATSLLQVETAQGQFAR